MSPRGALAFLIALAGLMLLFSLGGLFQGAGPLLGAATGRERAAQAAGEFVEAYGTFDYLHPTAYRRQLLELTSGPLKQAIETSGPDPAAIGQRQVWRTRVVNVQVTSISGNAATAVVRAEHTKEIAGQPTVRTRRQLHCTLARDTPGDGDASNWKVVAFRLVSERAVSGNESEVNSWNR